MALGATGRPGDGQAGAGCQPARRLSHVRATLPAVIDRRGYVLIVSSLAAYAAAPGWRRTTRRRPASRCSPTRCGWRWPTTASVSARRTCPGSTPPWSATPRPTCPRSRTAQQVAVAVEQDHHRRQMRGRFRQGHRGPREPHLLPGWVGLFRWLKPMLSTPVGEIPVRKTTAELMPRMDAEVAALGRSTSAYNRGWRAT